VTSNPIKFQGHLIYQACKTHGASADEILKALSTSSRFDSNEHPGAERNGFETLSFNSIDNYSDERAASIHQDLDGVRFYSERLEDKIEVYDPKNDRRIEAHPISNDSADLLSMSPNTLLVRGSKRTYQQVNDKVQSQEPAGGRISQLSFDPDFLLWLFWQYSTRQSLSDLEPLTLSGAEFVGERTFFGRETRVSGSSDIFSSTPVLIGLLSGEEIHALSGKFEYHGEFIEMDLTREGRVQIKTTGHIAELPMPERVLLACDAVNKTVEVYRQWVSRPLSSKYPPAEFFASMVQKLSDQDVNVQFSMDSLLREYAEKRGEGFEEYIEQIQNT
jgi:hypothetical protein